MELKSDQTWLTAELSYKFIFKRLAAEIFIFKRITTEVFSQKQLEKILDDWARLV